MTDEFLLRWDGGELDLMGWNEGPQGEFRVETLTGGTDWGNPQSVRRTLRRFLLDGSVSVKDYDDNRTIPLALRVSAVDGAALAGGEAELAMAETRRCELVWTPREALAPAAVFVATGIDLTRRKAADAGDPLGEDRQRRYYTLSLDCLPHAYSDEWLEVPAIAQEVSTPTLVDNCGSTTNWSSPNANLSTVTTTGDATVIKALRSASGALVITRTGAVDFSTEPYLAVKVTPTPPAGILPAGARAMEVQTTAGGPWRPVAAAGTDAGRVLYAVGTVAASVVAMRFTYAEAQTEVRVFQLDKQATPRSAASRQQVRTIDVPGSRRTPGFLLVESPTSGLGTTIVYTGPAYDPTWSSGDLATRATLADGLSGGYSKVSIGGGGNPLRFQRPLADIPAGSHAIWARLFTDGPGVLTITAELCAAADAALLASSQVLVVELPDLDGFKVMPLGVGRLPAFNVPPGSTALLRLVASWSQPGAEFGIDELLTFLIADESGTKQGSLTAAEVGSNRKLWLDAPSLVSDSPAAFVGSGAKESARPLSLLTELPAWPGTHALTPPETHAYVATGGTANSVVSARFRDAWHTHPARLLETE